MKSTIKLNTFLGLFCSFCVLLSCKQLVSNNSENELKPGRYLGSLSNGNYVWGGAMNLSWNELNETILKSKLQLNTQDEVALEMVDIFNNSIFTKNDLDNKSYYVKSGYGQKTVDFINKESRQKFPDKSFSDLNLNLSETDIISYAYFF